MKLLVDKHVQVCNYVDATLSIFHKLNLAGYQTPLGFKEGVSNERFYTIPTYIGPLCEIKNYSFVVPCCLTGIICHRPTC